MYDFNPFTTMCTFHAARTRPAPDRLEDERHGYAVAADTNVFPRLGDLLSAVARGARHVLGGLTRRSGPAGPPADALATAARPAPPAPHASEPKRRAA
jgi:hypothetical protein